MTLQLTISRDQMATQPTVSYTRKGCSLDIVKPVLQIVPSATRGKCACQIDINHPRLGAEVIQQLDEEIVDIYFGKVYRGKSAYQAAIEGGFRGTEEDFNYALANLDKISKDDIADGAITTPKIFDRAVTSDKIADNSIKSVHIAPGVIQEMHLSQELMAKINDDAGYVWEFAQGRDNNQNGNNTSTTIYTRM